MTNRLKSKRLYITHDWVWSYGLILCRYSFLCLTCLGQTNLAEAIPLYVKPQPMSYKLKPHLSNCVPGR